MNMQGMPLFVIMESRAVRGGVNPAPGKKRALFLFFALLQQFLESIPDAFGG